MNMPRKVRIATGEVFDVDYYNQEKGSVGITFISEAGHEYNLEITKGFYEVID